MLILSIIFIFVCCEKFILADILCDDWETYDDGKCLKLYETPQSYDEAAITCVKYNSTLVTIRTLEEQHFIENYLYTKQRITENVWTSLQYISGKYKWINDLEASYTNWAEGSPKHSTVYCVEIVSDNLSLGKWSDNSCSKLNFALCQKMPKLSMKQLLDMFVNTTKQLENTISEQNNTIKTLNTTNNEMTLKITSLENTIQVLNKTQENNTKCNAIENADNIYGLKNYTNFTENNIRKALFYPSKTETKFSESEAKAVCYQHSGATLVEIESYQKQTIVELFAHQLSSVTKAYWIGGSLNSSGKYVWLNSGNEFKYTNWAPGNPSKIFQYVCIGFKTGDAIDGKWISCGNGYDVICEINY